MRESLKRIFRVHIKVFPKDLRVSFAMIVPLTPCTSLYGTDGALSKTCPNASLYGLGRSAACKPDSR